MASTRQHFVWGWGRLPRAHSDAAHPSPHYHDLIPASAPSSLSPLPPSSSFSSSLTRLPRLLEALETSTSLRSISAAQQHVAAVTNSGEMYSWGTIGPAVEDDEEDEDEKEEKGAGGQSGGRMAKKVEREGALRFRPVWGMEDKGVYQLSVTSDAMFAITATNDVFGWKWADEAPSDSSSPSFPPPSPSLIPSRSLLPHALPSLSSLSCTAIACGSNFCLFLTSSGSLYSLGAASHGRLAMPSPAPSSVPTLVPLGSLLLTRISAGFTHAAAVTHTGQLLTWGCGLHGRLGNGRSEGDDQLVPLPVGRELDSPVIDVSCGYAHTLALDVEGRVWSFGSNAHGQCGWGEDASPSPFNSSALTCNHPVCIDSLSEQVVSISAGAFHSACITAVSELFVWGWNRHGQLGVGGEEDSQPSPVCVSALSGMDVRLVSCAADYTVAVTDHFMSIEPNYFSSHSDEAQPADVALRSSFSNGDKQDEEQDEDTNGLQPLSSASSVVPSASPVVPRPGSAKADTADKPVPVVFEESQPAPLPQEEPEGRVRSLSTPTRRKRTVGISDARASSPPIPAKGEGRSGGQGESLRSLLSLVKEALLITPLPDTFPEDLMSPLPLWSPSAPSLEAPSSPPRRLSASHKQSKQQQQVSAFNKMTSAYLSKLHRTAREAAAVRMEEARKRAREERMEKEATKRNAKKERLMEEAATEWVKVLLPKWGEPKVKARGRELVMKVGIPTKVRGQVWPVLIGNALMINAELYRIFGERANKFKLQTKRRQQLTVLTPTTPPDTADPSSTSSSAASSSSLASSSLSLSDSNLEDLRAFGKEHTFSYIDTDLARTFPSLAFFQEECAMNDQLRSILYTFCFYRPDVGYVQGMSYLAAYLLLYMPPYKTFICFANLLNSPFFHAFLKMDASLTSPRYGLFTDLLHENSPSLSFHLSSQGVSPELYLLEWCLTLFCKRLKLDVVGRVWDLYVLDGEMAVYRVGVAMLMLMNAGGALEKEEMGGILRKLAKDGHEMDEERLMAEVAKVVVSDRMQQRLQAIVNARSTEEETP